MSSREDILASIRQHTQTRYDKPDIADMKRLSYPDKIEQFCAISRAVGEYSHKTDLPGCYAHCFRIAGYFLRYVQSR